MVSSMRTRLSVTGFALGLCILLANGCFHPVVLPTARFTWSQETPFTLVFDGSVSDGGDSTVAAWVWDFGDGKSCTGPVVRHTYVVPGDYRVELTVHDERGFKNTAWETVHAVRELRVPEEYWTIQEAIDEAADGDIVVVSPGRYWENFSFRGKAICVRSVTPDDPISVANTIIEPGLHAGELRVGPIITFNSGEGRASILEGLTIRGVEGAGAMSGNGVFVSSSSPTIRGNVFTGHLAGSSGAAIYLFDSEALVVGNRFDSNTCDPLRIGAPGGGGPGVKPGWTSEGGAIHIVCTSRSPTISGNQFLNNTAVAGGAIYVSVGAIASGGAISPVQLRENTFISNRATGRYSPHNETRDVGGALQALYRELVDLGARDTNTYQNSQPQDLYYEYDS